MTNKKKQIDWRIVCTGIIALTGLEIYALSQRSQWVDFSNRHRYNWGRYWCNHRQSN